MPDNSHLSDHIVDRMERLAEIGHWRWNVREKKLFWSKGVYKIHGLDFLEYSPTVDAAIDGYIEEDRYQVEQALNYAIENKAPFKVEARIKRPNDEIRHIVSQGECETDEDGELIAVFGIIQDITLIKQQEELYQLSAMASDAAIWDWDIAKDSLRWAGRSAQVLGYPINDNLPMSTADFYETMLHPDDIQTLKKAFENHFTKLDNLNIEVRLKRQDGTFEWFLSRAQAQFDELGKAIRVCGSMTSIQQVKDIQDKLEGSNSDLESFACMAAHEIKRPIRSIASYLELIQMKEKDLAAEPKDYIAKSIEIANETSHMVDEILEYASLQDAELTLSEINTDKVIKLIIRSMKEDIKQTGTRIGLGNLPVIIGDETKLKTVITNIIQNALKYTADKPPEIEINIFEDTDKWRFSFSDNGRGMSQKDADKAFVMFERADNIGNIKGTGIGLAICNRIINMHEGNIWIESKLNKGTTFYFTIPKDLEKKK
ncbi:MAG: PAS domain-containing protein [Alphaproteobacteria bacterium]|nr:PAS domain-containing protein [Alphaproteobacteria bacterium]